MENENEVTTPETVEEPTAREVAIGEEQEAEEATETPEETVVSPEETAPEVAAE